MSQVQQLKTREGAVMTFTGQLTVLRSCLIRSLLATALAMAVCNIYVDDIIAALAYPAGKLYFIKPAEAFFIYFKVTLDAGGIYE